VERRKITSHDFNTAEPQRDVTPDGTIATLHITVRPGQAGESGWLRRSKDGNSEALDLELTVVDGAYAKRKFWSLLTISGTTDGHAEAGRINGQRFRAILESARGVRPDDKSDEAAKARRVESFGDFDGMRFIGRIGVEPARNGYKAKNTLDRAITPDSQDWRRVEQMHQSPSKAAPAAGAKPTASSAPAAQIARPKWAS
jgi:hypothetical protein